MNKAVRQTHRYALLCFLCIPLHLCASETVKYTKNYFANTLADLAFLPMVVVSAPISYAGELLFSDTKSKDTETENQTPKPQERALEQAPVVAHRAAANHQAVGAADVPRVVQAAIAGVPETDGPVYINLNLNTQQAAATAVAEPGQAPSPEHPSESSGDSWLANSKKYLTQSFSRAVSWIMGHKLLFLTGCTGATFVGIQTYLWYLSHSLAKKAWSSWANQCSLSDLYRMDQQELIKSLVKELERVYAHANPVINVQRFLQEISKELSLLHRYKSLVERTRFLSKLFFINSSLLQALPDRIQRCTFLHDTLAGWVSKHQETCTYEQIFSEPRKSSS
jgi:hypothetical protein